MRIIVLNAHSGRIEIAVEDHKVVNMANVLENAKSVDTFYVDGLNCSDQQKVYGAGDFIKWISPIQN